MTTRLEELVQCLQLSEPNDKVEEYLKFYVTKEKQVSKTLDESTLLALSLDSLKCNKLYKENGILDGIVKEEFLPISASKKHSSAATSSLTKVPIKDPRFILVKDDLCLWNDWVAASSVREKVLQSVKFFDAFSKQAPDGVGPIMDVVLYQLEYLVEHEGCPRPPLPTNRAPSFTDIVYLKCDEVPAIMKKYINLGKCLADFGPDETFDALEDDPGLLIFCLYMYEFLCIYRKGRSLTEDEQGKDAALIAVSFRLLIEYIRSKVNDFRKVAEIFKFAVPLVENAAGVEVENIFKCIVESDIDVIVMLLKAIVKYEDMVINSEKNDICEFFPLFLFHPIYSTISFGFSLIRHFIEK